MEPDVLDDPQRLGAMTTPVTVVGEETIVGYDEQRLAAVVEQQE